MEEQPLSVAVAAVVYDNKILLIKRPQCKKEYPGFLALPGGKVEKNEHISQAAVREIKEESGIESEFKEHVGFVSEHLKESGEIAMHFALHICRLHPKTLEITEDNEGELDWYNLDTLHELKDSVVPSDYLIIEKIVKNKEGNYFDCVIEKSGGKHTLKKFA